MSQFYDVSSSTYLESSRASVTVVAYTSKLNEFDLFLDNPELSPTTLGLIIKPRRVNKGALKEFRTKLHEIVPEMKNLTHDEIENLIDERNKDVMDDS